MRLRTTAGAYAGHIRDYDFGAAQAALKSGTAERIEPVVPVPARAAPVTAPAAKPAVPANRVSRDGRHRAR